MLSPSSLLLSMMVLEIGNKGGKFLMFLLPIGWHSVLADDIFRRKGTTGESDGGVLSSCLRGGFTPEEVLPVLLLPMSWLCDFVVGLFSLSCNAWMLIKLSLIDQSFTNHWYISIYIKLNLNGLKCKMLHFSLQLSFMIKKFPSRILSREGRWLCKDFQSFLEP